MNFQKIPLVQRELSTNINLKANRIFSFLRSGYFRGCQFLCVVGLCMVEVTVRFVLNPYSIDYET